MFLLAAFAGRNLPTAATLPVAALGTVTALAFYLLLWVSYGRDPRAGTVVVTYEPPKGISPALARYLRNQHWDSKVFSAAMLSLVAKGYLRIEERRGEYTLVKIGDDTALAGLEADERVVALNLFPEQNELLLLGTSFPVRRTVKALKQELARLTAGTYLLNHRRILRWGIKLSLVAVLGTVATAQDPAPALVGSLIFVPLAAVWSWIVYAGIVNLYGLTHPPGGVRVPRDRVRFAILGLVIALPGEGVFLVSVWMVAGTMALLQFAVLAIAATIFAQLLKAPTRAGRALLDRVEGFRRFLMDVEARPLQVLDPTPSNPQLFVKYLPYALAMDLETQWAHRFGTVVSGAYVPTAMDMGCYSVLYSRGSAQFGSDFYTSVDAAVAGKAAHAGA